METGVQDVASVGDDSVGDSVVDSLAFEPIPPHDPDPMVVAQVARQLAVHRGLAPAGEGCSIAARTDPAARAFAVATVTTVLEVLDRRRPVAHLTPIVLPHIIDQVTTLMQAPLVGSPGRRPATSVLCRVHMQWVGPDAAEVAATYTRGGRVHAVAARVGRIPMRVRPVRVDGPRRTELRWMLVNFTTA
ncbi:Rv3235 family protein [Williamsia sp. CHRR-6]|uniref:Rv3235 family protein n=1 Tax=Williamsia sp. CHRR-6 TaxID=2835871 RepID=UPI001BD9B6EB|nr:Rv3235 family protein [Williamsia sp. CHRR-6]MBT0565690.1 hypothetical protein [Williamsia sp. CHRR-6]